jgi:hypothetical protein
MRVLLSVIGVCLTSIGIAAESQSPIPHFTRGAYDPQLYEISESEITHGQAVIHLVQVRKRKFDARVPFFCRAWVSVSVGHRVTFQRYFADIFTEDASFGLFFPRRQPPEPFRAIVKLGDFDGRLFLVGRDGNVVDLDGGYYFLAANNRYLFSKHSSDHWGLVVLDLQTRREVTRLDNRDPELLNWYSFEGDLIASLRDGDDVPPREKPESFLRYDFAEHQFMEWGRLLSNEDLAEVQWWFQPPRERNCHLPPNPTVERDARKSGARPSP